jgi:predicted ATP-dependent protease
MGFTHALIPKGNIKDLSKELLRSINIHAIEFVTEAIEQCIDQ